MFYPLPLQIASGKLLPMEFHQLRYFVAAAEELSVSRAAIRIHVSQPALSRQIRLLEEELELKLFDRIKQRIHLTEAGKFFLVKARQILCDSEPAVQQAQEKFGGVGLMPALAAKLPHAGCSLVALISPTVYSELLLVLPKTRMTAEMESLVALVSERAEGI